MVTSSDPNVRAKLCHHKRRMSSLTWSNSYLSFPSVVKVLSCF
jgi:hypothetical protein